MGCTLHPMGHPPFKHVAAAFLVILATTLTPASAAIYRCTSADDPPRFSQFPCGHGESLVLEPLHTVTIPALSEVERQLLEDLARQQRTDRERRAEGQARAAREAELRREERRKRCEAARTARAGLQDQRRKGYALSEARQLDRRDAELAAEERANC